MWIAVPAAALYAAYLAVLRRQTRRHRAEAAKGDTRFVVAVSERVRSEIVDDLRRRPIDARFTLAATKAADLLDGEL